MPVEFVDATTAEIDAVAADLTARVIAAGRDVPTSVEDGKPLVTFSANFGWTEQPTPMQYIGFIVILLENAGFADAREVVIKRMDWFLLAYATGGEPLPAAGFIAMYWSANS